MLVLVESLGAFDEFDLRNQVIDYTHVPTQHRAKQEKGFIDERISTLDKQSNPMLYHFISVFTHHPSESIRSSSAIRFSSLLTR